MTNMSSFTVVELVSWQKWNHLRDAMRSGQIPEFDNRTKHRLPEEHILHLACQHQAPRAIVELLAEKYPQSISCAERKGRYPLHIACAKGLTPKVIDLLLKSHPRAAGVQDEYGKTPLMYACESYVTNFRLMGASNSFHSPDDSLHAVVELILDEVPTSANVEDHDGANALEYALESGAELPTVKLIQNAARDNWRSLRRLHRGLSHDELRESFTSLSQSFTPLEVSSGYVDGSGGETKSDDDRIFVPGFVGDLEKKVQAARTA
jgi:ankyrin repeat protein